MVDHAATVGTGRSVGVQHDNQLNTGVPTCAAPFVVTPAFAGGACPGLDPGP